MKIRRIGAEWYNEPDFNGTRIFSTYFRKKSQITNFMKIRWIGAEWYNESHFNETWIFSTYFRKNSQISNFMKIRRMGAEWYREDGRANGRIDRHYEANSR